MADTTQSTQQRAGAVALGAVEYLNRKGDHGPVEADLRALITERDDAEAAAKLNAETVRGLQQAKAELEEQNGELRRRIAHLDETRWDAMDRGGARDESLGSALSRLLMATALCTDRDIRLAREFGDAALKAVRG